MSMDGVVIGYVANDHKKFLLYVPDGVGGLGARQPGSRTTWGARAGSCSC